MVKWGRGVTFLQFRDKLKNPPQSPTKLRIFSSFSLIFPLESLESGTPTPIKVSFLKLTKISLSAYKVWSHELDNFSLMKHLKLGVLGRYFQQLAETNSYTVAPLHRRLPVTKQA